MKTNVKITLPKGEILKTALGNLRLAGLSREGIEGETAEHVALLQSGDLPEDMAQLTAHMKTSWRLLLRQISEWVKEGHTEADNLPMKPEGKLVVVLALPGNFAKAATDMIADAMHRYMCDRITGEWLMRTSLDLNGSAVWMEKAAADLADLRIAMWTRTRPERPAVEPVEPVWHDLAPKRETDVYTNNFDSDGTDGEEQ